MKKIIAVVLSIIMITLIFSSCSSAKREIKNDDTYAAEIEEMNVFDNTVDTAMPQTIIHKLVIDHLSSPMQQGKTTKKVIFIGFDGFRADGIENIYQNKESSVMYIKNQGGLYHTFSGGITGVNEQATSTSPSWMAMLTGGWGSYNGITNNSQMKNENAETFLTIAAKMGYSASFTTSWREHTALSYRPDIVNSITQGLPVEYTHQIDDAATYYQILKYVSKPEGVEKAPEKDPDVIFFTLEYTDHAGHETGFGNGNEEYIQACKDADACGWNIIKTIEARSTYEQEDWLIIISTDHGGTKLSHGGQSPFERMTWLATNKSINVSDEYLNYEVK